MKNILSAPARPTGVQTGGRFRVTAGRRRHCPIFDQTWRAATSFPNRASTSIRIGGSFLEEAGNSKSRSDLFPVAMTSLRWQSLYYYCLNALIRKLKLSKELVIVMGLSASTLRTSERFGEKGFRPPRHMLIPPEIESRNGPLTSKSPKVRTNSFCSPSNRVTVVAELMLRTSSAAVRRRTLFRGFSAVGRRELPRPRPLSIPWRKNRCRVERARQPVLRGLQ
jgi:hypothetical protein